LLQAVEAEAVEMLDIQPEVEELVDLELEQV
jgi:hypothetical protein